MGKVKTKIIKNFCFEIIKRNPNQNFKNFKENKEFIKLNFFPKFLSKKLLNLSSGYLVRIFKKNSRGVIG